MLVSVKCVVLDEKASTKAKHLVNFVVRQRPCPAGRPNPVVFTFEFLLLRNRLGPAGPWVLVVVAVLERRNRTGKFMWFLYTATAVGALAPRVTCSLAFIHGADGCAWCLNRTRRTPPESGARPPDKDDPRIPSPTREMGCDSSSLNTR